MSRALSLLAIALCVAAPAFAQARFLAVAEDVPLPAALIESAAGGFSFEGGEGRLVETDAAGRMAAADVRSFYELSMPALGWSRSPGAALIFLRGRERLTIDIEAAGDHVEVRYRLISRRAALNLE